MNMLENIARDNGRDYIIPDDIEEAMQGLGLDIEMDFLEILGGQIGIGIEDTTCCAFVLWEKLKEKRDGTSKCAEKILPPTDWTDKDPIIIELCKADPPMFLKDIAARVGLSREVVRNRAKNVLQCYEIRIPKLNR